MQPLLLLLLAGMASQLQAKSAGLVVSGLGGNPEYAIEFAEQGQAITTALGSLGSHVNQFVWLDGATADRQVILDTIATQAALASDTFVLILLGHGSVDRRGWRFNITGPDLSTDDLVAALAPVQSAQQLIVAATSASGALLDVLSQPGRTVVTATKSGGEINAVRFPEFLTEAMVSTAADIDRNEILTIAEAWRYANEKTQQYYQQRKLLASEHARLRGENATQIAVARLGALRDAHDNPVVSELLDKRLVLEQDFHALRDRKESMPTADYYAELETLMLAIAELQQSIDEATGWVDSDV